MQIKKGDQVKILSGKDRGKTGAVLEVFRSDGKIVVEGVNLFKKRIRPKRQGEKGQTVMVPRALHASNAQMLCPNCKKPSRVGRREENGAKVRYCKNCKAAI